MFHHFTQFHQDEIAFCPKVTDISGLGDHYRLKVWQCSYQLTGYHSLLNVPHVALTRCDIADLRVLRNAKSLRLTRCNQILDLTPIASLKEANLLIVLTYLASTCSSIIFSSDDY